MSIILNTINIKGTKYVRDIIYFNEENNTWEIKTLIGEPEDLENIESYAFRYDISEISVFEVKEIIKNNICNLTDREVKNLSDPLEDLIWKKIYLSLSHMKYMNIDKTKDLVEEWIKDCENIGINPVPKLSSILQDICSVKLVHVDGEYEVDCLTFMIIYNGYDVTFRVMSIQK